MSVESTTIIRRELKSKFNGLPEDKQFLYLLRSCVMCPARLTKRQLNRCIEHNIPTICIRCDKKLNGRYDKCRVMLNQMSLFYEEGTS